MDRIKLPGGGIEYVPSQAEKDSKAKYKTKKKGSDLSDSQAKELIFELARIANLI